MMIKVGFFILRFIFMSWVIMVELKPSMHHLTAQSVLSKAVANKEITEEESCEMYVIWKEQRKKLFEVKKDE